MIYLERVFDEDEFAKYLINELSLDCHYRYLLGTLLAYYAIENIDVKIMVKLNSFITTDECAQMSTYELLYKFGIDLN